MMTWLTRLKAQSGASLIQVTLGIAVMGILSFIGSEVMLNSFRIKTYDSAIEELNRAHLVAMIKGQSVNFIRERLGSVALENCFKGFGVCPMSLLKEIDGVEDAGAPTVLNLPQTGHFIGRLRIQSDFQLYSAFTGVTVLVTSGVVSMPASIRSGIGLRQVVYFIPESQFASPDEFDWTCPPGQTPVGANYSTKTAICRPYPSNVCAEEEPIRIFGQASPSCQPMCNKICANGFADIGLFDSDCTCKGACSSYGPPVYGPCSAACGPGTRTVQRTNLTPDPACPPINTLELCSVAPCNTCGNAALDVGEECDGSANCLAAPDPNECRCAPGFTGDVAGNCNAGAPPVCNWTTVTAFSGVEVTCNGPICPGPYCHCSQGFWFLPDPCDANGPAPIMPEASECSVLAHNGRTTNFDWCSTGIAQNAEFRCDCAGAPPPPPPPPPPSATCPSGSLAIAHAPNLISCLVNTFAGPGGGDIDYHTTVATYNLDPTRTARVTVTWYASWQDPTIVKGTEIEVYSVTGHTPPSWGIISDTNYTAGSCTYHDMQGSYIVDIPPGGTYNGGTNGYDDTDPCADWSIGVGVTAFTWL